MEVLLVMDLAFMWNARGLGKRKDSLGGEMVKIWSRAIKSAISQQKY